MSETEGYDLVVIGGGPGGYVAAIRAAQLGLKIACVEKRETLGGTCLNVGCIPSKALLHSSELFEEAGHGLAAHGVKVAGVELDLPAMMAQQGQGGRRPTPRASSSCSRRTRSTRSRARRASPRAGQVEVALNDGGQQQVKTTTYRHRHRLGDACRCRASRSTRSASSPRPARSSSPEVPKHLVVIGGGYIGLEMGSVWRRLGAEVTVVEFLDRIMPGMDGEIAKQFQRMLQQAGHGLPARHQGDGGEAGEAGVDADGGAGQGRRRRDARRRCGAGRGRPAALHRRARAGGGRRRARRARAGSGPTGISRTNVAGHLCHRRRDRRADAGAQGRGGGRRGGRDPGRPGRPCELRRPSPAWSTPGPRWPRSARPRSS